MVPPIAAINGAVTTHSQNEQENVDVRARPWTLCSWPIRHVY